MNSKTVLITGGASGIGLAMVRKFAAEGSLVFFIDTVPYGDVGIAIILTDIKMIAYASHNINNLKRGAVLEKVFIWLGRKIILILKFFK